MKKRQPNRVELVLADALTSYIGIEGAYTHHVLKKATPEQLLNELAEARCDALRARALAEAVLYALVDRDLFSLQDARRVAQKLNDQKRGVPRYLDWLARIDRDVTRKMRLHLRQKRHGTQSSRP